MDSTRRGALSVIATAAAGSISLATGIPAASAADSGPPDIATDGLALRFDRANGWGISAEDRTSGLIMAVPDAPLFELVLAGPDGHETIFRSSQAQSVQASHSTAEGRDALVVVFKNLGGQGIDVRCEIAVRDDGAIGFGAQVENAGSTLVRALRYPLITLNPHPSGGDSYLMMPLFEAHGVIRNPHRWMPSPYPELFAGLHESGLFGRSPGNLSAQFIAYYHAGAGLYSAVYDAKGWLKELVAEPVGGKVRLSWCNYFPELPAAHLPVDYEIVLANFRGDWYDAADIYKLWARKQPWCAKAIVDRSDLPEWITRGSLWLTLENWLKLPDGSYQYYGAPLAALLEKWRAILPLPPVLHYRWFDKYGYAATFLDWKPFWPSDAAYAETLPNEKKSGVRAWLMVNGYNLTITKQADARGGVAHDEVARFHHEAERYAVRGPDGQIVSWSIFWIPGAVNVELCRGTDWAQDFDNQIAGHAADLGFSMAQMDQTIGGGGSICYAKDHNHPPGGGTWFADAFRKQLRSFFELGRQRDPEFHVSEEAPNELFIPDLGTYQSRDHGELPPGSSSAQFEDPWDVRIAPVFAYLYHPYIIGYTSWVGQHSGAGTLPQTEEDWEQVGVTALAKSLVYGKLPGVWERYFRPGDTDSTRRHRILVQHAALTGGEAKRYLLFGEMLRPPPLETDTVEFSFAYRPRLTRKYPRVLHGAFEDRDGKRAVFLVNLSPEPTQCSLELKAIAQGRRKVAECRLNGQMTVSKDVGYQDARTVSLSPLEAMYVELT
jgi:hypothetical protein